MPSSAHRMEVCGPGTVISPCPTLLQGWIDRSKVSCCLSPRSPESARFSQVFLSSEHADVCVRPIVNASGGISCPTASCALKQQVCRGEVQSGEGGCAAGWQQAAADGVGLAPRRRGGLEPLQEARSSASTSASAAGLSCLVTAEAGGRSGAAEMQVHKCQAFCIRPGRCCGGAAGCPWGQEENSCTSVLPPSRLCQVLPVLFNRAIFLSLPKLGSC